MPRELAFLKRSSNLYDGMKSRFRERKYKTGRLAGHVFRAAREIPFTREKFQNWLSMKLGGPGGAIQCAYCSKWLTAIDMGVDHVIPVSQGGTLDLGNLAISCDQCNRLKGKLTAATFIWLKENMAKAGLPGEMTVADRTDIESRLRSGGMQYRPKPTTQVSTVKSTVVEPSQSLFSKPPDDDF